MTAALSVLPRPKEDGLATDAYKFIDGMLAKRLNETV
jgi:hypothetical protein